jgi:Zn-dependent peptidase ImmA (M78 family)
MRRGFKTKAEAIAIELRSELGLTAHDRLDCTQLASHLAIEIAPVTDLTRSSAAPTDMACLLDTSTGFSAMTVYRGTKCKIFYNPFDPSTRTANSIAHELSHVVLEHEPGKAVSDGMRVWNATHEEEASWQAGALLVPRDGAFAWLVGGGDATGGAVHFGVSQQLFNWRANSTGVVAQLNRRRQYSRR